MSALLEPVLITSRSFGSGSADPALALRVAGLELVRGDPRHDTEALRESLSHAVGWIAGVAPIRAEHMDLAPRLRVIARYGIGTDAVDLAAAAKRGIVVTNTPGCNAEAVADHSLALLLAAVRHIVAGDRAARSGDWSPRRGRELASLTIGLVGFGRVGRAFARRLVRGFGSHVLAHDPFVDAAIFREEGCQPASLEQIAERADVISLHLGGGQGAIVDAALLARMRSGTVLVNTARGNLIDEAAVAEALCGGILAAIAVDVLAVEQSMSSPLLKAPNVIVTPHMAAQTSEAIDRMGAMAADEVLRVLGGQAPLHPVS
jgi:D-3-phosphoglycerate dehydrogenase / 2-oxoglutarate reductase